VRRLEEFRALTAALSPFYRAKGLLRTVDGMAPIDSVTQEIETALSEVSKV